MTRDTLRLPTLTAALLAAGLAVSTTAQAAPQGLYSTNELLDAEVYTPDAPERAIGEVEDVLLDDDMRLRALVVDTGNLLDLGDKQYVIEAGHFSVETHHGERLDDIEYRVNLDLDAAAVAEQPEYTDGWWNQARESMRQAWADTQEGAASAWETTQEGASNALDRIGQALQSAGESAQKAAE
ncbi:PRC-barrel domain-containing protein [Halomonas organivorans]|uniref:Sporulation protein YlmC with PRC-barrel domain n=1 Tax=Halomonas organivorans TaxID=257772 RepID=A0A7W5G6I7_9GAMM|nr:PRC-barrel domain-containing protein [Halomonas organivorans]MBB3141531.1 sporulation protein YlmC with PRC-barrel domain [Halomonas organivorans]